jgi:glyoxylase-like metal-dependent hydrolase (beta-lactamase superfamily II)
MDVIELIPGLHFLRFPVGHVYLVRDDDGLTLVDTGVPGSGARIAEALRGLGHHPADVRRVVLTHFHEDHVGSAAEIATWGPVRVYAGREDSPFVRGGEDGPAPEFLDWEKPIYERAKSMMPAVAPAPAPVHRELGDGDVLDFGLGFGSPEGARVVAAPGHSPGSVAIYLPGPRVLFTGDAVANTDETGVIMGVFNADPAGARASFRRLAALDTETVCFGHGEPVTKGAAALMRAAAGL